MNSQSTANVKKNQPQETGGFQSSIDVEQQNANFYCDDPISQ